jgi:hypothetical protein
MDDRSVSDGRNQVDVYLGVVRKPRCGARSSDSSIPTGDLPVIFG